MKFSFSILLVVGFALSALKAQISPRISLKTGVSFSNQSFSHSIDSLSFDSGFDNLIGVPAVLEFDLYSKQGFRLGFNGMYQQKGTTAEIMITDEFNPNGGIGTKKVVFRYDYLSFSIPLGYAFQIAPKFNLVSTVAPRVDFDLNGKPDSEFDTLNTAREKIIFGLNGNLGVEYQVKNIVLSAQAQYQYDITPYFENETRSETNESIGTLTVKNQMLALLVGVGYSF